MIIAGLRLEPATRHSALVLVRRVEVLEGPFDQRSKRWPTKVSHEVVFIERFARGARYGEIVAAVEALVGQLPEKPQLVVDQSATGRPPVDLMAARHLAPAPVVIAETGRAHVAHRVLTIPRPDLVTTLALVLGEQRLTIGQALPDAETLARQLESYRVKPDADDPVDLAIACALAVWWGHHRVKSQVAQPHPPRIMPKIKLFGEITFDEIMASRSR